MNKYVKHAQFPIFLITFFPEFYFYTQSFRCYMVFRADNISDLQDTLISMVLMRRFGEWCHESPQKHLFRAFLRTYVHVIFRKCIVQNNRVLVIHSPNI